MPGIQPLGKRVFFLRLAVLWETLACVLFWPVGRHLALAN